MMALTHPVEATISCLWSITKISLSIKDQGLGIGDWRSGRKHGAPWVASIPESLVGVDNSWENSGG
jgi:hypothetical protein